MVKKITRKLTDYVTLKMLVSGEPYDFTDKKTGKQVSGVSKESIKLKFPSTTVTLLPHELAALLTLSQDSEVMDELTARIQGAK